MNPCRLILWSLFSMLLCERGVHAQPRAKEVDTLIVTLRFDASASGKIVRLGDVARLEGADAQMREKLARLDMAEVKPGIKVQVSRDELYYRLILAGLEPKSFKIMGPAQVIVRGAEGSASTEKDLVTAARIALQNAIPPGGEDVSIKLNQQPLVPPAIARSANVRYAAEIKGPTSGRVRVDVRAWTDDRLHGDIPVYFDVRYTLNIAVAKRRVSLGETITPDAVGVERLIITKGESFLSANEVIGKKARSTFYMGQRLTAADVEGGSAESPVLVKTRDTIHLVAHVGSVRVMAVGEAEQDGRMGDSIRVRNTSSKKVVKGRVVDRNVVEVEY